MILVMLMVLASTGLCSCSNSDDFDLRNDIIGSWYGTRAYYNPAAGTKYQHLSLSLESNGTGELEYDTPSGYSFVKFTYKVSGNIIKCKGVKASTNDFEVDDFEMTLSIEGNRLIPLDRYSFFILTRDDSVMTDSEGKEVVNSSNLLNNVWIRTDGYCICVIVNGKCTEYTLLQQYGKTYKSKSIYDISYDPIKKTIRFGNTDYNIVILNSSVLDIKNDKNHFVFNAGTSDDIPTSVENGNDEEVKVLLQSAKLGWKTDEDITRLFNFLEDGRTVYMQSVNRKLGSISEIALVAQGSYTLKNRQITCYYTDVYWDYGNNSTKDWFPGWTYNKARTRIYSIKSISSKSLTLEDEEGNVYRAAPL